MKACQKLVGIKGRVFKGIIRGVSNTGSAPVSIDIEKPSAIADYKGFNIIDKSGESRDVELLFEARETGRDKVIVKIDGTTFKIPVAVFNEKEFFVAMVISSNYHDGWDPHNFDFGNPGTKKTGHAFLKALRNLEPIYHGKNVPITWLIDGEVAKIANDHIKDWHEAYGDDFGLMPPSYFYFNNTNYNVVKSREETTEFLKKSLEDLERYFDTYTSIAGIDQWVGSVGSKFVKACEEAGIEGVWGMGYDHITCDTSMYHRGCPWDMYKAYDKNYRIPAKHPSTTWMFQWTTRDIINTVRTPTGESGSVIFSTDPDDIVSTDIAAAQSDYYNGLLRQFHSNMEHNDFYVFLMHQEDHDTRYDECNRYLKNFLDNIDVPVTFATLPEIVQWMNLKYAPEEHPRQLLYLEDVLLCRDAVKWGRGKVTRPDDWPAEGEVYPDHVAYYDRDIQVIFSKPSQTPYRIFDYKKDYEVDETGNYPEEKLPQAKIADWSVSESGGSLVLTVTMESDMDYQGYPVIFWDLDEGLAGRLKENKSLNMCRNNLLVFVDLQKGTKTYGIPLV